MYGFGDDRNPANDTVSVMEEILVEFIADVVCVPVSRYRVAEVWVSKLK
jgi:transcription initiation factor TFIID subunit 13